MRDDDTLLSEHLREPVRPRRAWASWRAAGPRAVGAEGDYAFVVEAVREGYLLHYGEPRILGGVEPDLALLARRSPLRARASSDWPASATSRPCASWAT